MSFQFHIIIPARFQSSRFPGKLLTNLNGQSILQRTYRQASKAEPLSITIATDNDDIAKHAISFGAKVKMTSILHQSGTERLAEVVRCSSFTKDDIIVNVQGDEPLIHPELIQQVVASLVETRAKVSTLCWPIDDLALLHNPNIVKVVRTQDNYALYFSRSPIPAHRDDIHSYDFSFRHIGLYAYRASFLLNFVSWPLSPLETIEVLEQLRILWFGEKIKVDTASIEPLQDINTREDLMLAQKQCKYI